MNEKTIEIVSSAIHAIHAIFFTGMIQHYIYDLNFRVL